MYSNLNYPKCIQNSCYVYNDRLQFVSLFKKRSDNIIVTSGVPQGGHISSLLFNIFIEAVSKVSLPRRILLFADDAKLFHNIIIMDDCLVP